MITASLVSLMATSSLCIHPIRSCSEFGRAEKEAIKASIGNHRIVMLGELTHGDGSSFEAKVELVKLLHQEMGFDVLVWESGLYDCSEMNRELGGSRAIVPVAQMGVFSHWSKGKESIPVFEYARQTFKSARPLTMAGFDIQPSGSASNSQFPEMVSWFEGFAEFTPDDRDEAAAAFKDAQQAGSAPDPQKAYAAMMLRVYGLASRMKSAVDKNPSAFKSKWKDEFGLRYQVIKSAIQYHEMLKLIQKIQGGTNDFTEPYNLRERANAANLTWLVDSAFRGRKVVVWAHNVHIFNGTPGHSAGPKRVSGATDSMGRIFASSREEKPYILGFMAYSGTWSWMGNPEIMLQTPSKDSMETKLHNQGYGSAFVDLANMPCESEWARPMMGTIDQQNPRPFVAKWKDGFDGLIFISNMRPRKQLP